MSARADHLAIASRIARGVRVLDVGCGEGELLALLRDRQGVDARGLELSSDLAGRALARGLAVIQGDADNDLDIFPDDSFDMAILSKAIEQMRDPAHVLGQLGRIAPEVVVSFRNLGRWSRRWHLIWHGRMPAPPSWHDADALHPCTASDMVALARRLGFHTRAMAPVDRGKVGAFRGSGLARLNWSADEVILHLSR